MLDTVYVFLAPDALIRISEGTGDNLLHEDEEEGYVDYIIFDILTLGFHGIEEDDGGQIMYKEYVAEKYTDLAEAIPDVLEYMGWPSDTKYTLLR